MKILVTGASGFAAEHLIPKLKNSGHRIIGTDRMQKPSAKVDQFVQCDLNNIINTSEQFPEIDMIIHLAAARADWGITDHEFYRDNFEATRSLLEFSNTKNIKKFIFVSSIAVYAQQSLKPIDEQSPNAPINAYGRSKELAEDLLIQNTKSNPDFSLNIVRPAVLYGPSNPNNTGIYRAMDNNIFRLIDGIYKNRFAFLGNEDTPKATAYVENFVAALEFLLPSSPGFQVFIYCDEPNFTTGDLVRKIRLDLGKSGVGPKLPINLSLKIANVFDYLGPKLGINFPITRARILTFNRPTNFRRTALNLKGFVQPHTSEAGLSKTINWYKNLISENEIQSFFLKDVRAD